MTAEQTHGAEVETPVGRRICASCDAVPAQTHTERTCPSCGGQLIAIRAAEEDKLIGAVIDGRFEIRSRLGEGGMGKVYRAWQRSVSREVAIKIIDERFTSDEMAVRRFMREARLASQLSQPNTVSVFDFGQAQDGHLFIAMELVRGRTLADVLAADGRFPVGRAARIGVQLCDALEAAHRLEIIHRDLKPANIVVLDDPPGRDLLKVLDFGLAKSLAEKDSAHTQEGMVVGTPFYLAPEVLMGEPPSPAADLYAVGVILAELTTGGPLWSLIDSKQMYAQKFEPTPALKHLPPAIKDLVSRLVAPEPTQRPASAAELRTALFKLVDSGERASLARPTLPPPPVPTAQLEQVIADTVPVRAPQRPPPAGKTPAPGLPPVPSEMLPRLSRPRRRPVLIGLSVLALGGLAAGAAVVTSRSPASNGPTPAPSSPPSSSAPLSQSSGAATAPSDHAHLTASGAPGTDSAETRTDRVTLHVLSKPSGALISLDGRASGRTPTDLLVPRGVATNIEARLRGRLAERTVLPDADQDVLLVLPTDPARSSPPTPSATLPSAPSSTDDALPF